MKNILIIAGSDSVGGAGIQADLKTCEALGCYGATALTCVVAENTSRVADVLAIPPKLITAQLECILQELDISAIKVGMLFNQEIMSAVEPVLANARVPLVLDPVCLSKAGDPLIDEKAIKQLAGLLKYATIATPNRFEFEKLLGSDPSNLPCDILVKKVSSSDESLDVLYRKDASKQEFSSALLEPAMIHGSGCTLSTAIACFLAKGHELLDAIALAKNYVFKALQDAIDTKISKRRLLNHKAGRI